MKLAALFSFAFFAIAGFAQTRDCLPQDDVREIQKRFNIQIGPLELCNPKNKSHRLIKTLLFIKNLEWNQRIAYSPYNQEIIGYKWLERLQTYTPKIGEGPDCKGSNAYVSTTTKWLYLCPIAFEEEGEPSMIHLVSTLLHESRHLDGPNAHLHVNCPDGTSVGCDRSLNDKGAYAAGVESMVKLAVSAKNVHPSLRYSAKLYAHALLTTKFLTPQTGPRKDQWVVILTEKDSFERTVFNYRFSIVSAFPYLHYGRVFELSGSAGMIVPTNKNLPALKGEYHEFREYLDSNVNEPHRMLGIYKDATPEVRATLKDTVITPERSAGMIINEKLLVFFEAHPRPKREWEVTLPQGTPVRLRRYLNGYPDPKDPYSPNFFVLNDLDQIFEVVVSENANPGLREVPNPRPQFIEISRIEILEPYEEWLKSRNNPKAPRLPEPQSQYLTYLLHKDGTVYQESPGTGLQPVPALLGRRFEDMSTQIILRSQISEDLERM